MLSKHSDLARASQREEVQPLDLVAVAVLAVKTAPGTKLAYSLFQSTEYLQVFEESCFSGGSHVNESETKSNRKMPSCCCISERLLQPAVSKQRALWNQYNCPEQVLTSNCSGLLLQLGSNISPTACPVTAGVQLGALVIAAPSLRNAWGLLVSDLFPKNT